MLHSLTGSSKVQFIGETMHDEHRKAQEMIKQAEKFKPQPDKWNKFVVNTYSRPRGLRAGK